MTSVPMRKMRKKNINKELILAFRVGNEALKAAEQAAAEEGLTRSDVARRALLRDLRASGHLK